MSPRVLQLVREMPGPDEITKVLGTVAEAVVFSDGKTVLHWLSSPQGTEIYDTEEILRQVREASGRSRFTDITPETAELPAGISYHVYVSKDPRGASAPDGSGDKLRQAGSLAEAVAFLTGAARDGCEYACLEILAERPAPGAPADVPVTGGKL